MESSTLTSYVSKFLINSQILTDVPKDRKSVNQHNKYIKILSHRTFLFESEILNLSQIRPYLGPVPINMLARTVNLHAYQI